jgi:hypothetical protein
LAASPDSVSPGTPERPTVKDLLNDYERAVCILHEANLEAGETDEDFDWDSARERYDAARSSIELYVAELVADAEMMNDKYLDAFAKAIGRLK